MKAHELARLLLAGPDVEVELAVGDPKDTYVADLGDVSVKVGTIDVNTAVARGYPDTKPGQCIELRGWQSSEQEDEEEDEG